MGNDRNVITVDEQFHTGSNSNSHFAGQLQTGNGKNIDNTTATFKIGSKTEIEV